MKMFLKTFGCQMNVYDSARVQGALTALGYQTTNDPAAADVIIINTCHIREKASEKLYSEVGQYVPLKVERQKKGLDTVIVVMGCVVQGAKEELMKRAPAIDIALGPQNYHLLPQLLADYHKNHKRHLQAFFPQESKFDRLPLPQNADVQAFLAIQEGCDNFCTYCVVPYTRGCEYSRSWREIVDEAKAWVKAGAKEIMLLGQNVNCWTGKQNHQDVDLGDLIREIAKIDGLQRIRYTTSYPSKMTQNLIDAHADTPKLMPYVHLPIQSGNARVLKAMNRQYTPEGYLDIVARFRKACPDIAISSDFIVGFPGETEDEFMDTLAVVRQVNYASSFSFKFSARPGTPASLMAHQISEDVKTKRLEQLQEVLFQQQTVFNQSKVGQVLPVLFTQKSPKYVGQYVGLSPYLQNVHVESDHNLIGQLCRVKITGATLNSLTAQLEKD